MRRPQNLKKSPTCFDKTAVFTQYRQKKWEIFQIFVAKTGPEPSLTDHATQRKI